MIFLALHHLIILLEDYIKFLMPSKNSPAVCALDAFSGCSSGFNGICNIKQLSSSKLEEGFTSFFQLK